MRITGINEGLLCISRSNAEKTKQTSFSGAVSNNAMVITQKKNPKKPKDIEEMEHLLNLCI